MVITRIQLALGWLLSGILLSGAIGCYNPKDVQAFLEQPQRPVSGMEYRVYPPDVIQFHSTNVPEITKMIQQVRPDGRIALPLIGEVDVAGKTPGEIGEIVSEIAGNFYEQVDVTVQVIDYRSQSFYVFGQVSSPGPYPWTGKDSLLDALAKAKPNNLAWPERIILVRGDDPQTGGYYTDPRGMNRVKYRMKGHSKEDENRPRKTMVFNLFAMVEEGDFSNNVMMRPNDVIYVQPHPLAAIGLEIQKLLFPISPAVQTISAPARAVTYTAP